MDQQKPRDNSMYYIGEKMNLKQNDKTILSMTDKRQLFEHKVLSNSEQKMYKHKIQKNASRE